MSEPVSQGETPTMDARIREAVEVMADAATNHRVSRAWADPDGNDWDCVEVPHPCPDCSGGLVQRPPLLILAAEADALVRALGWALGFVTNYCGCCGDYAGASGWCANCLTHIDRKAERSWDATFFAQHGVNCPWQVGSVAGERSG